jgi:hypothetical protein
VTRRIALLTPLLLALMAVPALAHDGGQGWYGPVDDKVTTNAGFIVIAFFPLFILFASLVMSRLEKRKYARKAAAKQISGDWHGGW